MGVPQGPQCLSRPQKNSALSGYTPSQITNYQIIRRPSQFVLMWHCSLPEPACCACLQWSRGLPVDANGSQWQSEATLNFGCHIITLHLPAGVPSHAQLSFQTQLKLIFRPAKGPQIGFPHKFSRASRQTFAVSIREGYCLIYQTPTHAG